MLKLHSPGEKELINEEFGGTIWESVISNDTYGIVSGIIVVLFGLYMFWQLLNKCLQIAFGNTTYYLVKWLENVI